VISATAPSSRPIALWLLAVAALVFAMVVVGGVTRLTRSGLSIVEWNPVMGAVPPLTQAHWHAEFEKYQRTPEYHKVNTGMSLDAFKRIYYVEWTHRLLGRLIGVVFFVPLVYFAVRRRLSRELTRQLIAIFLLGGLQGALGWFMVQSGLVDVPRVSPYRLTAHLALAVAIYGYVLWIALDLLSGNIKPPAAPRLRRLGWTVTALVFLMILAGGFVAGTRAGFVFNTFPLMNGHVFPPGLYGMDPWWVNLFENVATVQFHHRLLAYVLLIAGFFYWQIGRNAGLPPRARTALHLLLVALIAQVTLGIATLLLVVPVSLGALHQAGALVVFSIALYLNYALRPKNPFAT
jgi:cytochrome c oxidase assembly protein subunit 15